MPIVDVQIVTASGASISSGIARSLAEAFSEVFKAAPGTVWVRVEQLPQSHYAENGEVGGLMPVFLRVLQADTPDADSLAVQAAALAGATARCLQRSAEHIHIEFAPPGRGRVAFGGVLVR